MKKKYSSKGWPNNLDPVRVRRLNAHIQSLSLLPWRVAQMSPNMPVKPKENVVNINEL